MKVFADSLRQLEQVLDHARDRQGVLSSNVANVDTPGYRAQDLDEPSFDAAMSRALATTRGAHFAHGGDGTSGASVTTADDQAPREDGNTVSLERQMAKLEQNRVRYGAASQVISRQLALLRYAATDGHG